MTATRERIERIRRNHADCGPVTYGDIQFLIETATALTALCEEMEREKWQSIESAPKCKDHEIAGPRILGWSPEWTEPFPVKWSPGRPFPHWTWDSGEVTPNPPTHFQPLPQPPAT